MKKIIKLIWNAGSEQPTSIIENEVSDELFQALIRSNQKSQRPTYISPEKFKLKAAEYGFKTLDESIKEPESEDLDPDETESDNGEEKPKKAGRPKIKTPASEKQ